MFTTTVRRRVTLAAFAFTSLLPLAPLAAAAPSQSPAAQPAGAFATAAFERTWQRTDLPVARGLVARSWFWGPQPGQVKQEPASGGTSGQRQVQYFDKARMEVNPSGDPNSPWYVTNGLLTVELISGQAEGTTTAREPADIPLASDADDASAPTYRSFKAVSDFPGGPSRAAEPRTGQAVTATLDRAGKVGQDTGKGAPGFAVKYAQYEPATKHNIASVFWEFLNGTGLVYEDGKTKLRLLNEPWFYATGFPISEAYWARVKIGGVQRDALIQAFQRRVMTYVPDLPAGWKVQMGNIGLHYFSWRYGGSAPGTPPQTTPPAGRLAFVSDTAGGTAIFTMAPDGSGARQVTKTPGLNFGPRFAPNGKGLAYFNVPAGTSAAGVLASPALDPRSAIYLTEDSSAAQGAPLGPSAVSTWEGQADPAFSPNGLLLAFRGKPAGQEAGIFVANLASEAIVIPVRRLTTGEWDRQPVWSPDGRAVAFASGSGADNSQIWTVGADGTGKKRITDAVSKRHDQDPAWSPDGSSIAFSSDRATGKYEIYTSPAAGGQMLAVTNGEGATQRWPAYSPDGRWLAFTSDKKGSFDIVLAPVDGSQLKYLTTAPGLEAQPAWTR